MSHVKHELAEAFPQHIDRLHEFTVTNAHFRRLAAEYHELNRAIHSAEADVDPTSDEHLKEMRKQRILLKDDIYKMLRAEETKL